MKNFNVLYSIESPEKFDGMKELKVNVGTGNVICMANNLLPVDEKIGMSLYGLFNKCNK